MSLKKRVESAEMAAAKRNGDLGYKLFVKLDGEADEQARERLGIDSDTPGIIFISEQDAKL
jgi:hypothetical protein